MAQTGSHDHPYISHWGMRYFDWLALGHVPILELQSLVSLIKTRGLSGEEVCKSTTRIQLTEKIENESTALSVTPPRHSLFSSLLFLQLVHALIKVSIALKLCQSF